MPDFPSCVAAGRDDTNYRKLDNDYSLAIVKSLKILRRRKSQEQLANPSLKKWLQIWTLPRKRPDKASINAVTTTSIMQRKQQSSKYAEIYNRMNGNG
jgi:hypothetical protein